MSATVDKPHLETSRLVSFLSKFAEELAADKDEPWDAHIERLRAAAEQLRQSESDRARAQQDLADLRALVIQPWTRDDGKKMFKVNLAWWDSAETHVEALAMVADVIECHKEREERRAGRKG